MQRPPAYSAVKVAGRRAYALARAGEKVELAARPVRVDEFRELWRDGPRRGFVVRCSSGTYIRSLIADLGDAHCEALRRTAIGPFAIADADPERLIPLGEALGFLPSVQLGPEDAERAAHGVAVGGAAADGPVRLLDPDGDLIAIAEPAGEMLKPIVGFRG